MSARAILLCSTAIRRAEAAYWRQFVYQDLPPHELNRPILHCGWRDDIRRVELGDWLPNRDSLWSVLWTLMKAKALPELPYGLNWHQMERLNYQLEQKGMVLVP